MNRVLLTLAIVAATACTMRNEPPAETAAMRLAKYTTVTNAPDLSNLAAGDLARPQFRTRGESRPARVRAYA